MSVRAGLDRKLPVIEFDGVPLADALASFARRAGLPLVVNWSALGAARVKRDSPVTVRLLDVRASKGLALLLDSVTPSLTHYVSDAGRVVVTTMDDSVARNTVDRDYDVSDLLTLRRPEAVDGGKTHDDLALDLMRLVTETVAPDSWVETGGKYARIREKDGVLTITQTKENHRQLAMLFDQLREMRARYSGDPPPRSRLDARDAAE